MGKAISKQLEKPLHLRRTPYNPLHIRVFDETTPTKGGQMTPARLEPATWSCKGCILEGQILPGLSIKSPGSQRQSLVYVSIILLRLQQECNWRKEGKAPPITSSKLLILAIPCTKV